MVGREAESVRVDRALAALDGGHARIVVISGEAGIGKTRFIDEALERAGPDLRTLRGDCLALGSGIPYLPFAELLRDLSRQVAPARLQSILGPVRPELSRFLPELSPAAGASDDPATAARRGDEMDRLRLYEAFLRVAEHIAADAPTAFVIEDVQWIDQASLELLAFLAHGLGGGHPAALIVSVRPEEVEDKDHVLTLLAELGRSRAAERVELGPLSHDEVRRVLAAIAGKQPPATLAERIGDLSDGNPLFAEELLAASLRSDEETLPPKLRDLLAARLAQVPPEILEVLRVAAAAGRTIDDSLLTAASDLEEEQVQRAVRVAVDDYILVRAEGATRPGYRFRHEILRSLVASQLLPAEAARIHASYARALADLPSARQHAPEIANHWDAAGEVERALRAHMIAGGVATGALAFEQALRHYERALQLWGRVDDPEALASESRVALVDRAASAAARSGAFGRAIELIRDAIRHPEAMDTEAFQLARSSLRWYLWESGDIDGARAEAEAVLAESGPLSERWRANALGHLAGMLLFGRQWAEARGRALEARDVAVAAGAIEEQILAEGLLGWCLLLEGDVDGGLAAIRRALEATRDTERVHLEGRYPVGEALAHSHLAAALELAGRFEEMHEVAVAGVDIAARQGVARTFGSVLQASAARALYQLGRWGEASGSIDAALRAGAVGTGRISLLAVRALIAVAQGSGESAAAALAEADGLVDDRTGLDVRRWLTAAHAEHAVWQGDAASALARMAFVTQDPDAPISVTPGAQPALLDASIPYLLALGARACADVALAERASGSAAGLSKLAAEQVRGSLRRVARQDALAAAWAGDLAIAKAELDRGSGEDAATMVRRWRAPVEAVSGRPYTSAYVHWRLAEAHLARRDGREAAAVALEIALAKAESLAASALLAELSGLARRARLSVASGEEGLSVTPEGEQRPFGLTTREAEVLALLADGLTNQEIADQLYISPKTASVHVSNIYGKLGVESRVAAATMAHQLGLTGSADEKTDAS